MRNIAICGRHVKDLVSSPSYISTLELNGISVSCGLIHTDDLKFDRQAPENRFNVLVKIIAFSCNYRDKSLIFKMSTKAPDQSFYVVGSDFVGEVVDMGSEVTQFHIGDRVIGNNNYPDSGVKGIRPGIPSNNASKEYQVFHQIKLIKVPSQMPDEVAAAFSIGAQTAYSMVRKLSLTEGMNILVTSAKSNTSLFTINALKKHKVNIYATTTSMRFADTLQEMGVKKLIHIDPNSPQIMADTTVNQNLPEPGFDCIVDPFFDIHLEKGIYYLVDQGRYITCGLYDQYSDLINERFEFCTVNANKILTIMMLNNLQLMGNCLGKTEDLQNAIQDYNSGNFNVLVDSVFTGNQVADFFERTYNAKDRLGKVVYRYD